jgi:hypothetical protein
MVKRQLGITVSTWGAFATRMKASADRPVDPDSVDGLLRRVLAYSSPDESRLQDESVICDNFTVSSLHPHGIGANHRTCDCSGST